MRISLNITNYSWRGSIAPALTRIARLADNSDLDTLWVADHLIQADPHSEPDAEMLETTTTLGYLAAQTKRIRLGTMVAAATYRPPAVLIKAMTTLDVLSGGRAWLGIGSGYSEQEARAMGLSMPPVAERFELLEDTLRLTHQMWAGDDAAFDGTRIQLERPISSPTRRLPILVGGMGERKTLRLVARYADACNLFDVPDGGATLRHKLHVLARHCAAEGRDPAEIDKTVSTRFGDDATDLLRQLDDFRALGIEHAVFITAAPWDEEQVTTLAAVATELRE